MPDAHDRIERYEIIRSLGEGGMGSVFLARDTELDRLVALKVPRKDDQENQAAQARFSREARALARLDHPSVVRVYHHGQASDQPFIAMEFVTGETVAKRYRSEPRPSIAQTLQWVAQLCDGLAAVHAEGIVHRDVKPPNLIITDAGLLKIVDFGIARMGASTVTNTGAVLGTLHYMAPEQLTAAPVDARTDVFAVGAVLYELLTGQQAFGGEFQAVIHAILSVTPPPVSQVLGRRFRRLDSIVGMALQKKPDDRYQRIADLRRDLLAAAAFLESGDVPDDVETIVDSDLVSPPPARPFLKRPIVWLSGFGIAGAAAIAVFMFLNGSGNTPVSPPGPASTTTPSPAPITAGLLLIDAAPYAEVVSVVAGDGTAIALPAQRVTPLRLSIQPGAYTVTLRDASGVTKTTRAQVTAGVQAEAFTKFDSVSAVDYLRRIGQ